MSFRAGRDFPMPSLADGHPVPPTHPPLPRLRVLLLRSAEHLDRTCSRCTSNSPGSTLLLKDNSSSVCRQLSPPGPDSAVPQTHRLPWVPVPHNPGTSSSGHSCPQHDQNQSGVPVCSERTWGVTDSEHRRLLFTVI